jgi:hypothetical protein
MTPEKFKKHNPLGQRLKLEETTLVLAEVVKNIKVVTV